MQGEVDNFVEGHYWHKPERRVEDKILVAQLHMHFVVEAVMELVDNLVED